MRDLRVAGVVVAGALSAAALVPGELGVLCPLRRVTGIPCPLCGMTTSVLASLQLDLRAAVVANPAGLALVVLAIVIVLRPRMRTLRLPGWLPSVTLSAMWLWELHRFGYL